MRSQQRGALTPGAIHISFSEDPAWVTGKCQTASARGCTERQQCVHGNPSKNYVTLHRLPVCTGARAASPSPKTMVPVNRAFGVVC